MIVDREEEIKAFVPQEYWTIDAKLTAPPSKAVFAAAFYGDENGEIKINSQEESDKLFAELEKEDFLVTAVKKGKKNRSPAPALYHLHPAAGGQPQAGLPGPAHHEGRPGAV